MSDIFISYANEDRPRVERLAHALEQKGWSLFWDRTIPFGMTWRQVIGKELGDAGCVIVLWSRASIESTWVEEEADEGYRRNILIPVLIENVLPPIGFRSIQAADLSDWDGKTVTPVFERLVSDISRLIGPPQVEAEEERNRAEAEAKRKAEEEERKRAEAEAKQKAEEQERKRAEAEARRKAEVEERKPAEEEARQEAEEEERKRIEAETRQKAEVEERKTAEAEAAKMRYMWIAAAAVLLAVAGIWGVYQHNVQIEEQRRLEEARLAVKVERERAAAAARRKAEEEKPKTEKEARAKAAEVQRKRVKEAQRLLAELGYAPGPADGVVGSATERAIARFKRKTGSSGDPVVDESLLVALRDAVKAAPIPGKSFRDCPDCPEMVVVPAGSFTMGSPDDEEGRYEDEGPQRRVTISRPFAIGKYEVTRGEYAKFVEATGRAADDGCYSCTGGECKKDAGKSWRNPGFPQTNQHPVACVNWDDARAYVEWLSKTTGKSYRLLTEAEWEYAARAKTITPRHWGPDASTGCSYANGADLTAKEKHPDWTVAQCRDGYVNTAPAHSFKSNEFGLHDMLGNVWEWVADCWNDSYKGAPKDESAWKSGNCSRRVLRGGC